MLADLQVAIALGDWSAALHEALRLWRAHHHPQLVTIVERIGERIPDRPGPHRRKGAQSWWCAIAKSGDPLDVTRLVAHADISRGSPANVQLILRERGQLNPLAHALRTVLGANEQFFHAQWGGWFERAVLVTDWPGEDPRWLPVIERWLAEPTVTHYIYQTRQTIDVTAICGKPLRALRDALARSVAAPPALAKELAALVERLTRVATRTDEDDARVWAAVAEAPRDLAARQVLADYLLSHGDPRGDMFTLQLSPSPRNEAFAMRLLSLHRKTWLAGIDSLVMRAGTVWRHGMIEVCRVGSIHTTDAAYELAPAHRELACVRTLVGAQCPPARYAALLHAMPQVERIGIHDANVPAALAVLGPRWPHKIVELGSRDLSANYNYWPALSLEGVASVLPDVETLIVLPRSRYYSGHNMRAQLIRARELFPRLQTIHAPRAETEVSDFTTPYDGAVPQIPEW